MKEAVEKTEERKNAFFPTYSVRSVYTLDFERLYEEGYRALFFDIDNTLVYHDEPALPETVELFARLKKIGFKTAILSNNGKERVKRFAEAIGGKTRCESISRCRTGIFLAKRALPFFRRSDFYRYPGRE